MLNIYKEFVYEYLAIPVMDGQKTEHEKFSGADFTFTIEAMMKDGKALQAGTSHYLGQNFAKPFDISFKNKENKLEYAYGTSWGVSTRLLGALIMTHGDDRGIIIPPKIAPTQVDIIELFANKDQRVHETASKIKEDLLSRGIEVKLDDSDKGAGFKAANSEIHGTPLRIEVGPRDLNDNQVLLVRRDTLEKVYCHLDNVGETVEKLLSDIQNNLFNEAKKRLLSNIVSISSYDEFKQAIDEGKWVYAAFDGDGEDEKKIKEETGASTRCIPFIKPLEIENDTCFFTKRKTKRLVIFAKSY